MTVLDIEGVFNVRDVGGMATARGRVREGALLRSGSLVAATPSGIAEIERRVGHIVDLRDGQEVAEAPSAVTSIATTHLPLFLGSVASFFDEDMGLGEMYRHLLDESGQRLADAVRVIATENRTLVHCTVGKDRTGVTVALALSAVEADRDAVVADYALTASLLPQERNRRITAFLRAQHPHAENAVALATLSPAEVMRSLLDQVDARWGSAADYLRAHGLADDELAALRDSLVER
ncbi:MULTISPECIES: tyrosine-protein phosphatase [unclassified Microbacterium]|uniref:tyrosine-protein phosphatase n=1 Tax=unclassified Microbacterium TaxID=2609290 RepID=UPI001DFA9BC1|nr:MULTISPECIES: tyrosine-protein phosphatase [unclassified Microbacterium]CAH0136772.1 Tyrosine-protein phosphatase [Microbacterium sp. Bi121]HWK77321.1 tyrosine-protein phosphatase [Microbacterium sp.]